MRKVGDKLFDGALRDSLKTIKEAHIRLHVLDRTCTTAAVLASQIELCDVLLIEIFGIHTALARDLRDTGFMPQFPAILA